MPQLLAILKYLCEATHLVIFRCTAFGSSYFSGPWWAVPVRKNIQVFLGKNPPCFQRMSEALFLRAQQVQQQAVLLSGCPQTFLGSAGTMQLSAALWDHTHHRCFVDLPLTLTDSTQLCAPNFSIPLLNTYSASAIFWHWVLLRLICLHRRV